MLEPHESQDIRKECTGRVLLDWLVQLDFGFRGLERPRAKAAHGRIFALRDDSPEVTLACIEDRIVDNHCFNAANRRPHYVRRVGLSRAISGWKIAAGRYVHRVTSKTGCVRKVV